jgi:hypothetical protein
MKRRLDWTEETAKLKNSVAYIAGSHTCRAFDVVVFHVDHFTVGAQPRDLMLKTSGSLNLDADMTRVRRMSRRLERLGYRFNTRLDVHPLIGVRGAVFLHRAI